MGFCVCSMFCCAALLQLLIRCLLLLPLWGSVFVPCFVVQGFYSCWFVVYCCSIYGVLCLLHVMMCSASTAVDSLFIVAPIMGFCVCYMLWCAALLQLLIRCLLLLPLWGSVFVPCFVVQGFYSCWFVVYCCFHYRVLCLFHVLLCRVSTVADSLFIVAFIIGFCVCSMFCFAGFLQLLIRCLLLLPLWGSVFVPCFVVQGFYSCWFVVYCCFHYRVLCLFHVLLCRVSTVADSLFIVASIIGFCVCSMFCCAGFLQLLIRCLLLLPLWGSVFVPCFVVQGFYSCWFVVY